MTVYRVFPFDVTQSRDEDPGGALFVPRGGYGRIDTPESYRMFNVASSAEAAITESFGCFTEWSADMLHHVALGLPFGIAAYDLSSPAKILDLNAPSALAELQLRPSDIVVRDMIKTQAWAMRIFALGGHDGISWWSFYGGQWSCFGIWEMSVLSVHDRPRVLTMEEPSLIASAEAIATLVR